jgi:hypothetical protein
MVAKSLSPDPVPPEEVRFGTGKEAGTAVAGTNTK